MKRIFFILPVFIFLLSCKKDPPAEPIDLGYDYYPDHLGRFVVYDCDSIVYVDIGNDTQNYKFQVKEIIDSLFTDNEGRPALRISRYKKMIQNDTVIISNPQWVLQDVWWANKTATTAEVVEENYRYIKLIFPVEVDDTWNGNSANTLGGWDYQYTSVDEPLTLGSLQFDKTLTVLQYYSGGIPIYYKKYQEKYARGVGLIEKEITDYTWDQNANGPIIGSIKYGLKYKMTAIQYGTE
jgi:hypothetical protein